MYSNFDQPFRLLLKTVSKLKKPMDPPLISGYKLKKVDHLILNTSIYKYTLLC